MVQRYAHLAPEHLARHAGLIDEMALCKDTNQTHPKIAETKDDNLIDCLDYGKSGGSGGVRTHDQGIMSPLL